MGKLGRPTNSPRNNNYRIRMTDDELKKLEFCVGKSGMSKADIIRLGIVQVYEELNKS